MKYKTLYVDPPWMERGGGKIKRGADRHYDLMATPDIMTCLQILLRDKVEENAHLYLWVTNNFLPDGLLVLRTLGFRYVTMITWVKDRPGLGQYFRGITEHCLFGVRGRLPYKFENGKRVQGVTAFYAARREHSRKPDEMRRVIECVSYPPRLEVFARARYAGWDAWGDELPEIVQRRLKGSPN